MVKVKALWANKFLSKLLKLIPNWFGVAAENRSFNHLKTHSALEKQNERRKDETKRLPTDKRPNDADALAHVSLRRKGKQSASVVGMLLINL